MAWKNSGGSIVEPHIAESNESGAATMKPSRRARSFHACAMISPLRPEPCRTTTTGIGSFLSGTTRYRTLECWEKSKVTFSILSLAQVGAVAAHTQNTTIQAKALMMHPWNPDDSI